jgi:hypothetical protein
MKQQIQIRIAEPCHENWNSMHPSDQGRFCLSCQKQVVDFSGMTDKEILEHISSASRSICGRADNGQLNRLLVAPPEPRSIWWRYWMGLAASFMLLSSRTNAQVKHPKHPTVHTPSKEKKLPPASITMGTVAMVEKPAPDTIEISGSVVDEKNNPVPYASVRRLDSKSGVAADSMGHFVLQASGDLPDIELTISAIGFETKKIAKIDAGYIRSQSVKHRVIQLETVNIVLKTQLLGEMGVVVIARPLNRIRIGGMYVCRSYTVAAQIKNSLKEMVGINEVKIYPNPISLHGSFNISFDIKEQGRYNVQFTDAAGKILGGRQINITQKKQVETFEGNLFAGSGVYFVSVISSQRNKVYTNKLLVQ